MANSIKHAERIMVEGDASSASYFVAAAAIAGGEIEIKGVGAKSVQGDIGFANVMEQVGATNRLVRRTFSCAERRA